MTLSATYQQLNEYIVAKTKQPISLSFENEKKIEISYTKKIFIKEINIRIKIKIEKVHPSEVVFSYEAPVGFEMLIDGALSFVTSKMPELTEAIHVEEKHRIGVNLEKIKKLEAIVKNISIQNISFTPSNIMIEFSLKH